MNGITMAILFATLSGIIFGTEPPKDVEDTFTIAICLIIFVGWMMTGLLAFVFAITQ